MDLLNNNIYTKQDITDFIDELKVSHAFRKNRQKGITVKFDCGCVDTLSLKSVYDKLKSFDSFICRICMLKKYASEKTEDDIKREVQKRVETQHKNYIEKYGSIEAGNKIMQKKRAETMYNSYGITNVFQREDIKQKIRQTNIEKYGVENSMQNPDIVSKAIATKNRNDPGYKKQAEKLKNTFDSKYGCHPSQLKDAKCFESKNRNWIDKLFATGILEKGSNFEYHKLRDENGSLPFNLKCPTCKSEFEGTLYGHIPSCPVCHPYYQTSKAEQELADFVKQIYPGNVILNDRSAISPKELDIYLPDLNIAIEFDGIYWHADDPKKQIIKTQLCEQKGIRLIHIFENEWEYKSDLVRSIIKSIITNTNNKIYARQCEVKEVSKQEVELFCNTNHIQGYISSSVRIGLFHNNELIQVMTFGKSRFNKNYEWEILRECSKQDLTIVGGKSKIFRYFEKVYNPQSIISYCDRRYFNGKSYLDLGMTLLNISDPSYMYIKNKVCLPRYQCQKHKLSKLLPNFDPALSETDNMQLAGYHKIYDCGNFVFIKRYKH